jgi:hypothetical protein
LYAIAARRLLATALLADAALTVVVSLTGVPIQTGSTPGAAAVDVGLPTVFDAVRTRGRRTGSPLADPTGTIRGRLADFSGLTGRTLGAPAIDSRLLAVFDAIGARSLLARPGLTLLRRLADRTLAVSIVATRCTGRTCPTRGSPAVDIGLSAVLDAIRTGRSSTRPPVADATSTVGVLRTGPTGATPRTVRAAAVGIGLLTVLDAVSTARRDALVALADTRFTVTILRAIRSVVTRVAVGTAAVGVGLLAILDVVLAGGVLAGSLRTAANTGDAVGIRFAGGTDVTGVALGTPAIDSGLFTILDAVRASRSPAGALGATYTGRAIFVRFARITDVAGIAFGAAAVDVGLSAVLNLVFAGWRRALADVADVAFAVLVGRAFDVRTGGVALVRIVRRLGPVDGGIHAPPIRDVVSRGRLRIRARIRIVQRRGRASIGIGIASDVSRQQGETSQEGTTCGDTAASRDVHRGTSHGEDECVETTFNISNRADAIQSPSPVLSTCGNRSAPLVSEGRDARLLGVLGILCGSI